MSLFGRFFRHEKESKPIEMILDHDGKNWRVSGGSVSIAAPSLNGIDRELEKAFQPQLQNKASIRIFMCCNNEVIPMWMRPYMNHYFNRILELPLRYAS